MSSIHPLPPRPPGVDRLNVAVIGSGISGMSAAWLLSQRHQVTLFERDQRLGGHSNTVEVALGGQTIPVDTGFIVYNEVTYPNLVALFDHLNVPTQVSDMSFSVSLDRGAMEYSGADIMGLFGQRRNLIRPRLWSMVKDVMRFYLEAPRDLNLGKLEGLTLGQYLSASGYSRAFVEDHLLPMAAAIWSSPLTSMSTHSAASIVRFFDNHGLLRLYDRPVWRTVCGGSREYVRRLIEAYAGRVKLRCGARRVIRSANGPWVEDETGARSHFDHVVVAAHADEALALLDKPTPMECEILGAIRYHPNPAILHQDPTMMPKRRRIWASWNYLRNSGDDAGQSTFVTYWMNRLQANDPAHPLFVTLNPPYEPAKGTLLKRFMYHHPLLDAAATMAQKRLWQLQGYGNTWYCGAYFGAGFHEDGLQSGLAVAEQLGGVRRPWRVAGESDRISLHPWHFQAAE
jgi:predicted NAD/FAD-binding protein